MRRRHEVAILTARLLLLWRGPVTVLIAAGITGWVAVSMTGEEARRAQEVDDG
jgi:hypothetical protein